ncbi:hypothetical protein SAMN05216601_103278 [Ectopseudomonas composti]|uniref:Uncharacterized protein n=1 Tax=Ectopseudomonas composti TaxID=658457 RepID=A0A1I5L269_9GAMM|nr:hypothetical protein SAMN05216601_103278 [Pseudomonas composti]
MACGLLVVVRAQLGAGRAVRGGFGEVGTTDAARHDVAQVGVAGHQPGQRRCCGGAGIAGRCRRTQRARWRCPAVRANQPGGVTDTPARGEVVGIHPPAFQQPVRRTTQHGRQQFQPLRGGQIRGAAVLCVVGDGLRPPNECAQGRQVERRRFRWSIAARYLLLAWVTPGTPGTTSNDGGCSCSRYWF